MVTGGFVVHHGLVAVKLCGTCGEEPKYTERSNRDCVECWLYRQPLETQTAWMRKRQAAVPESLRRQRVPERQWPPGRRWCSGCWSFPRLRDCSGSRCKTCASVAKHSSAIASKYTLGGRPFTEIDYQRLLALQGGRCYLCRRQSPSRRLAVDHSHATGEVRGLLCPDPDYGCNLKVLARFDADPDPVAMAQRLLAYLSGDTPASRLLQS